MVNKLVWILGSVFVVIVAIILGWLVLTPSVLECSGLTPNECNNQCWSECGDNRTFTCDNSSGGTCVINPNNCPANTPNSCNDTCWSSCGANQKFVCNASLGGTCQVK